MSEETTKKTAKKTTSKAPAAKKESAAAKKPAAPKKAAASGEAKKAAPKKAAAPRAKKAEEAPAVPAPVVTKSEEQTKVVAQPAPVASAPIPTPEPISNPGDKTITMKTPIIVRDLAVRMNVKPFQMVHQLMEMNIFATLDQSIEEEVAQKVCKRFGYEFTLERRKEGGGVHKPEPIKEEKVLSEQKKPVETANMKPRSPIITFMGHVDHGKTSLLDAIRKSRIASGEAGGITQHIGASRVKHGDHYITFLDTPGHEAFTAMRARGANITDIVVLVVAADDGIMPQTLEALKHAQAAGVAIIVAVNKIDLPAANPDRVKKQLQEKGVTPEDWGGETIFVDVSATKNIGIDKLLEMMLLQAEILELKSNYDGAAKGVIIESQMEQGRGATASALIQSGTLKIGDFFICGTQYGKVKALIDDKGQNLKEAGPSVPVKVIGFEAVSQPGEEFVVIKSEKEARSIAEERAQKDRLGKLERKAPTLENIFETLREGQKKTLNVILKADVQGSIEAIIGSLNKIESQKINLEIVYNGVGPINVNDIMLAKASNAVVIGFNTKTDNTAAQTAKREEIQIKLYSIIYELIDQIKEAMMGLLEPELREKQLGTAQVKKVFELSKFPVAGSYVQTGRVVRNMRARVVRAKQPIYDGEIVALKHFKDDALEVRSGAECGIRLGNFSDYLEGDIIECYQLEKIQQSL